MIAKRVLHILATPSLIPGKIVQYSLSRLPILSDETVIKLVYRFTFHKAIDLKNPRTFNEKIQWLKLHDHNLLYTKLVDKCAVKEWVADKIGSQYITQTYARWDRVEDIDISGLPERFVLKCNHDSGITFLEPAILRLRASPVGQTVGKRQHPLLPQGIKVIDIASFCYLWHKLAIFLSLCSDSDHPAPSNAFRTPSERVRN